MLAGNIAFAAMTISAGAQLSSHWQACTGNPGIDWDTQIKNCTALIQSGTELKEKEVLPTRKAPPRRGIRVEYELPPRSQVKFEKGIAENRTP